jgi:hypothetical protein
MTIKQKQALLCYLGYYTGGIDGSWGAGSIAATKAFQTDAGLTVDGVAGSDTEKALKNAVANGMPEKKQETVSDGSTAATTGTFWDDVKYFKRDEFRCPCGKCDGFPVEPKEALVRQLVKIREHFGAPITIVPLPPANAHAGGSGVRCQAYNDSLRGSVKNSRHVQGKAADIIVSGFSGSAVKAYCDSLVKSGNLRYCYIIGGGNSVHVDIL